LVKELILIFLYDSSVACVLAWTAAIGSLRLIDRIWWWSGRGFNPLSFIKSIEFLYTSPKLDIYIYIYIYILSAFRTREDPQPTSEFVAVCPCPDGLMQDGTQAGDEAYIILHRGARSRGYKRRERERERVWP
jgi:hypothetical protein